jgi:acyl-coenzyme A synthetase/AMP-(fatty) acid ligase
MSVPVRQVKSGNALFRTQFSLPLVLAWLKHCCRARHTSRPSLVPGMDVRVVDAQNREVKRGELGALVIKLPLPPGTFLTLWNADERFVASYLSP